MVSWAVTLLARATLLPRMDFRKVYHLRVVRLVTVPALLTSSEEAGELVGALEVRFLANKDENLHFGLLKDSNSYAARKTFR